MKTFSVFSSVEFAIDVHMSIFNELKNQTILRINENVGQ